MCCKLTQRQNAKATATEEASGSAPPFARTLAAARDGDAFAQYSLGMLYLVGTGVAQSYSSAFAWFKKCAGHPAPPCEVWAALGDRYRTGLGVAEDAAEAVSLYRVGVAAGEAHAQFGLAVCLEGGIGVPQPDFVEAFALYTAAAAQDDAAAILNLGVCYFRGRGVARDAQRAFALFQRAAAHPPEHRPLTALRPALRPAGV